MNDKRHMLYTYGLSLGLLQKISKISAFLCFAYVNDIVYTVKTGQFTTKCKGDI